MAIFCIGSNNTTIGDSVFFSLMIEVPNKTLRQKVLSELAGVEDSIFLQLSNERKVKCEDAANDGVARTTDDGKTSAVHFLKFGGLSRKELESCESAVMLCSHPKYSHSATLDSVFLKRLAEDLD